MSEDSERRVGPLTIRIDRGLCVGFGDCVEGAPAAFVLDSEGLAVFTTPESVDRATLLAACEACPVDAITVLDEEGRQLVPEDVEGSRRESKGVEGSRRGSKRVEDSRGQTKP